MDTRKVPLMLSIPKKYRDQLRKMAAEHNYKNPDDSTFAATIATEIICKYLDKINSKIQSQKLEEFKPSSKTSKPKEETMT
jgi:hypothetical protein